ncbi:uncharacterized protein LOC143266628 [Megachile rotundata]|uniref:uncharacterized protein LOC143266628 n=1 Tax=Megachile rotundata TaxID=143995 RepID=UPI003FD146A6
MDGVIRISEGIQKMAIAQAAAHEAEKVIQSKEKNMDEKEKIKEQETKEIRKEEEAKEETRRNTERRREAERVRAESVYPLSRNKIRKMIKRLLKHDRRSRSRGRGRGGETSSGWRRGGHSGWRRGGRRGGGGHSGRRRGGRGGVNKNFFIINQNR